MHFAMIGIVDKKLWVVGFYSFFDVLDQRFPTWGTWTPRGTFACPKGYIWSLQ